MATKAVEKTGKLLPGPVTSKAKQTTSVAEQPKETEINLGEEFQIAVSSKSKRPQSKPGQPNHSG